MTVLAEAQRETWHDIYAVSYDLGAYVADLARYARFNWIIPADQLGNESPVRMGGPHGGR